MLLLGQTVNDYRIAPTGPGPSTHKTPVTPVKLGRESTVRMSTMSCLIFKFFIRIISLWGANLKFSGIAQMCTYWHGKTSHRVCPVVDPGDNSFMLYNLLLCLLNVDDYY